MKQRPGADALLDAALHALQEDLLPTLSSTQKFQAAMIARAVSIARHNIDSSAESCRSELQSFTRLYGDDVGDDLVTLRKRLAADIRARKFTSGTPEETRLIDHLVETTATELRFTNTKYLAQRQRGRGAESAV